jgi:arylformamidase
MTEPLIFDVTRALGPGTPVWPGDTPFQFDSTMRLAEGETANVSAIRMSVHTGTHADAPYHVLPGGMTIDEASLDVLIGPALLIDVSAPIIEPHLVEAALNSRSGTVRLLFRTHAWKSSAFPTEFAHLSPATVGVLRDAGVILVGTDAPSVDAFDSADLPVHRGLAEAGVVILENLALTDVPSGAYELIALPLKLLGADGAPIRAVLRPL